MVCTAMDLCRGLAVSRCSPVDVGKMQDSHKCSVPEQPEHFLQTLDLSLLLELDLASHEREFFLHLMVGKILADPQKRATGLLDLAPSDELTRRVGHECGQADEEDNAPGDLNTKRQAPLGCAIGCIAACEADPVGHHGSER